MTSTNRAYGWRKAAIEKKGPDLKMHQVPNQHRETQEGIELIQRGLDILDSTTNHIFDPPAGRGEIGGALALPILLHLGRGRHLFAWGQGTTSNAGGELELQDIADFIAGTQNPVEIVLGVSGRDAEPSTRGNQRSSRVTNNHHGDFAPKHLVGEGGHLGRVEKKEGNDGRVIMAVYYKAKTLQSKA